MKHTAFIRSKPKWSTEETIAYYEKRKVLELEVMKNIPFNSIVLDNTNYNWDKMFDAISYTLSLTK